MERLTDPLTTTDAKLWADEFMKVKARLGEQKFDHAMMLGWFANAIMAGFDEANRRAQRALDAERANSKKWEDIAGLRFAGDHKFVREMELLKIENATLQAQLRQVEGEKRNG